MFFTADIFDDDVTGYINFKVLCGGYVSLMRMSPCGGGVIYTLCGVLGVSGRA
jgi:hypothetical protein